MLGCCHTHTKRRRDAWGKRVRPFIGVYMCILGMRLGREVHPFQGDIHGGGRPHHPDEVLAVPLHVVSAGPRSLPHKNTLHMLAHPTNERPTKL